MTLYDIPLAVVYLLLILMLVWQQLKKSSTDFRKLALIGITAKILGSLAFILIYKFYYRYGDTFEYMSDISLLVDAFIKNPNEGMSLFLRDFGVYDLDSFHLTSRLKFYDQIPGWTLIRVGSIIGLLGFKNFIAITLIFAYLSFQGSWFLFISMRERYPNYTNSLFVASFLVPTTLFWTTGLLKDTVCITMISFLFYATHKMLTHKLSFLYVIVFLVSAYLLYSIKIYLAYSFLIALGFWVLRKLPKQSTYGLRNVAFGMAAVLICVTVPFNYDYLQRSLDRELVENQSMFRIKRFHDVYYEKGDENSSKYNLGEFTYSAEGIIEASPYAFATVLVRPYPWEAKKAIMLLMTLENLVFLSILFWLILKRQFWQEMKSWLKNDEFIFSLIFIGILSVIVGVTSYNFGLLMRLKAPLLPFLGFVLVIIHSKLIRVEESHRRHLVSDNK